MKPQELKTKKITIATLKIFARKFQADLYVKEEGSFNGMIDMVGQFEDAQFEPTTLEPENAGYYKTGIQGVYTVGRSRDYFSYYEDEKFYGIHVFNACGSATLATRK